MDLKQFKSEHNDLYMQIVNDVTSTVTGEVTSSLAVTHQSELDAKDTEITALKSDKTKLTEDITAVGTRVIELEKSDVLRKEEALDAKAESIWSQQLSESSVPERLYKKVRQLVTREKFMADDKFDNEAFKAAVDAEICDWEEQLKTDTVQGFTAPNRTVDGTPVDAMSTDATVDRMLGHLGQKRNKE